MPEATCPPTRSNGSLPVVIYMEFDDPDGDDAAVAYDKAVDYAPLLVTDPQTRDMLLKLLTSLRSVGAAVSLQGNTDAFPVQAFAALPGGRCLASRCPRVARR